jgi:hypothetical protein
VSAVDGAITRITEAPTEDAAKAIASSLTRRMLLATADQLHIETEGHGLVWIRNAIVKEARA